MPTPNPPEPDTPSAQKMLELQIVTQSTSIREKESPLPLCADAELGELGSPGAADEKVFRTTPYRWFILLIFVMLAITSEFIGITFTGISVTTSKVTGVSVLWVNSCAIVPLVSCILLNFPSISIIERIGLKRTVSNAPRPNFVSVPIQCYIPPRRSLRSILCDREHWQLLLADLLPVYRDHPPSFPGELRE